MEKIVEIVRPYILNYANDIKSTDLKRVANSLASLSDDDTAWLAKVRTKLGITKPLDQAIEEGAAVNQTFLTQLLNARRFDSVRNASIEKSELAGMPARIRSLPWVVAREWGSEEGIVPERTVGFEWITSRVKTNGPEHGRILVPGSGCSRLVLDLAERGSTCVGVEFDAVKLLASVVMLDMASKNERIQIQPYVLETCNRMSPGDNTRTIMVPDTSVTASTLARITLDGREISEAIPTLGRFDVVTTSFLIDTCSDIEKGVSGFHSALNSGGLWINCGPLQYHYGADKTVAGGICPELNVDEVIAAVKAGGFEIVEQDEIVTQYLGNPKSIMSTNIRCLCFVARKI